MIFRYQRLTGTVVTVDGEEYEGLLAYDLDEAWEFEILDTNDDDVEFQIPFRNIKSIVPKNYNYSMVFLKNGESLLLGGKRDVSDDNDGILVFTEEAETQFLFDGLKSMKSFLIKFESEALKEHRIQPISLSITGAVFLILYFTNASQESYLFAGWIALTLALVWISNYFLTKQLDRNLPWLKHGNKRFSWQLGLGIMQSLIIINLSYLLLRFGLIGAPPTNEQMIAANVLGILLLLPTISINFGIQFLSNWKTAQFNSEQFQKETIKAELTTLKNHLDPHFLFNNLNILPVDCVDKDLSQTYLEKFADVYRNILQSSEELLL